MFLLLNCRFWVNTRAGKVVKTRFGNSPVMPRTVH